MRQQFNKQKINQNKRLEYSVIESNLKVFSLLTRCFDVYHRVHWFVSGLNSLSTVLLACQH